MLWWWAACIDAEQVAGVGAIYAVRCSASMEARGETFVARCTPDPCLPTFSEGPLNHVVVALDPTRGVVGYAERVCVQDLRDATSLFQPPPREALGIGSGS